MEEREYCAECGNAMILHTPGILCHQCAMTAAADMEDEQRLDIQDDNGWHEDADMGAR